MAYEKQTWTTGDVITAEKLNNLENGVANAGGIAIVDGTEVALDKTWQEIFDLMKSGTIVFIKSIDGSQAIQIDAVYSCIHMDNYMVYSANTTYVTDSPNGYPAAKIG